MIQSTLQTPDVYKIVYLAPFLLSLLKLRNILLCVTADIGQVIHQHLLCENCILN